MPAHSPAISSVLLSHKYAKTWLNTLLLTGMFALTRRFQSSVDKMNTFLVCEGSAVCLLRVNAVIIPR